MHGVDAPKGGLNTGKETGALGCLLGGAPQGLTELRSNLGFGNAPFFSEESVAYRTSDQGAATSATTRRERAANMTSSLATRRGRHERPPVEEAGDPGTHQTEV